MSRTARRLSATNVYHIILRGINRQIIFEDNNDFIYFKRLLLDCRNRYEYEIFGYCLMDNHIHLLLKSSEIHLEVFFKSLEVRYVYWFNGKYQRTGHLFQGRFFSVPVESETALINTIRYIHNNPVKAGIVSSAQEYPWSSCSAYFFEYTDELLSAESFLQSASLTFADLRIPYQPSDQPPFPEPIERCHLTDEEAIRIMKRISGCLSHSQFQKLQKPDRNKYIQLLYKNKLSVRQLVRICGIPKSTIERILGMKK